MKTAWLAVDEEKFGGKKFLKADLLEVGNGFRKIKMEDGPDKGTEVILPSEETPYMGFFPALFVQEDEPQVWRFKGRSLPLVDRKKQFKDPAQADALHAANSEMNKEGQPLPYIFLPHTIEVIDGINRGDHQFLIGHKGVGKTSLLLQIAAHIGQPCIRLNFTGQISISDLVGSLGFGPKGTEWHDGPVITAMRCGYWLILDEFDFGDPSVLSMFHPVLERSPYYCLKENSGEIVQSTEGFRVFATGNSIGGDKDGEYAGTQQMNSALLDRFAGHGRVLEIKPMTMKQERGVLLSIMPNLPYRLAKKATAFAAKVRSEHLKSFSTREVLNWCRKMLQYKDAVKAANLTFLPIVQNEAIKKGISDTIRAMFGSRIIIGRYNPNLPKVPTGPRAVTPAAPGSLRASSQVTDPAEQEAMVKAYHEENKSFEQVEIDFKLKTSNGMNAYRVIKKWKDANPGRYAGKQGRGEKKSAPLAPNETQDSLNADPGEP